MKSVSSKQADATLAKLTTAMQRNTTLATGNQEQPNRAAFNAPASTYKPQPVPPVRIASGRSATSGIRFKPNDHAKIRQIIHAGLDLQENLSASDVIRIVLHAYDPRKLTGEDIARLHASDGRFLQAKGRGASPATVAL